MEETIGEITIKIDSEKLDNKLDDLSFKLSAIISRIQETEEHSYLKELMRNMENLNRQSGRSTILATAANENNGIFVVCTSDEKRMWKKRFPNLEVRTTYELHGMNFTKPIILDHLVIYDLLGK